MQWNVSGQARSTPTGRTVFTSLQYELSDIHWTRKRVVDADTAAAAGKNQRVVVVVVQYVNEESGTYQRMGHNFFGARWLK